MVSLTIIKSETNRPSPDQNMRAFTK